MHVRVREVDVQEKKRQKDGNTRKSLCQSGFDYLVTPHSFCAELGASLWGVTRSKTHTATHIQHLHNNQFYLSRSTEVKQGDEALFFKEWMPFSGVT